MTYGSSTDTGETDYVGAGTGHQKTDIIIMCVVIKNPELIQILLIFFFFLKKKHHLHYKPLSI